MTSMKTALLAGAAIVVSAVGAQADDLTALKAQIESLNARVASMEAAPSVPAGYSLLSIGEGQAHVVPGMTREEQASFAGDVTTISVLPTADAPVGAVIEWNGYARAMLRYRNRERDFGGGVADFSEDDWNIFARGRLNVTARTDTSVGEVGVRLRLEGNGNGPGNGAISSLIGGADDGGNLFVDMPVAWGWWQMTPELALGGGFQGSLGNIGFGYDGCAECNMIDSADVYANNGPFGTSDTSQMRLSYASGPLGFAIAVEDAEVGGDGLGAAAEISYAGDTFSGEISGMWRDTTFRGEIYHLGVGVGFNLDPVALSMAAGIGSGEALGADIDYWYVNGLASMNLSDAIFAEAGIGYKVYDIDAAGFDDREVFGVMGGIYYKPVDQLTIGLEAEYIAVENDALIIGVPDTEEFRGGLVTKYLF